MAFSGEDCLICGEAFPEGKGKLSVRDPKLDPKHNFRQKHILDFWKNDCINVICEILFGTDNAKLFLQSFQNNRYCFNCDQIIRDVHFYWMKIKVFQSKIDSLADVIRNLISQNFKANKNHLSTKNSDWVKSALVNSGTDGLKRISKSEIVELMFTLSAKQHNSTTEFTTSEEGVIIKSEDSFAEDTLNMKEELELSDYENNDNALDGMDDFELPDMDDEDFEVVDTKTQSMLNVPKGRKPPTIRIFKETKKPKVQKEDDDIWTPGKTKKKTKKRVDSKPGVVPPVEEIIDTSKRLYLSKFKLSKEQKHELFLMRKRARGKESRKRRKWFPCPEEGCKEYFRFENMIDGHVREVHKGEKLDTQRCQRCPQKFQTYQLLCEHIHSQHKSKNEKIVKDHICKFCGKGYFHEEELNDHLSVSHQGDNPFKCGFCEQEYTHSSALVKHVKNFHSDVEKSPCQICGRYVETGRPMEKHLSSHNSEHKCNLCSNVFSCSKKLFNHIENVHKQQPVICEICGTSCSSKYRLAHHIRTVHNKDQRYKCKICDKAFVSSVCRTSHEIGHTGIRNFVCKVCGKAFLTKGVLTGHELIHQEGYVPRKFHRRKKQQNIEQTECTESNAMELGTFINQFMG